MTLQAAVLMAVLAAGARTGPATVTCRVRDDPQRRTFALAQAGGGQPWQLSMQDRESGTRWVRLALPGAAPAIGDGTATLRYKNANGGRQVTLEVASDRARLDVYVEHGLEVNIEPDLDPAVDRMNTNGPLTALDCSVEGHL